MRLFSLAACLSICCPVKRLSGLAACAACALSAILSGVGGPSARWLDFGRCAGERLCGCHFVRREGNVYLWVHFCQIVRQATIYP